MIVDRITALEKVIQKERKELQDFEENVLAVRKSEINAELHSLATTLKSLKQENIPKLMSKLTSQKSLVIKAKSSFSDKDSFSHLFAWIGVKSYIVAFQSLRHSVDTLENCESKLNAHTLTKEGDKSSDITVSHLDSLHEMTKCLKLIGETCNFIQSAPHGVFTNLKQFSQGELVNSQAKFEKCLSLIVFGLASTLGWPLNMQKKRDINEKKLFHRRQNLGDSGGDSPSSLLKKVIRIVHENGLSPFLVIDSLVASISVRLKYHFEGKRETNRIDKPEWYLSYVQKCLFSVVPFVHDHFDNLLSVRDEESVPSFSTYLTSKLASLVREKMKRILLYIKDQESTSKLWSTWYSHCINEMIQFDRLIQNKFGLRGPEFECSRIVCTGNLFEIWFSAEKSFAEEKAKEIILEEDKWLQTSNNYWPNILTSLHQLLSAVTERYKFLPDLDCRLKFLENLQKPILIGKFLRDAMQEPEETVPIQEKIKVACSQCNFCLGVVEMLQEWDDDPLFIELHEYSGGASLSLFSSEIDLFKRELGILLSDRLLPLCSDRFKGNARAYSRQIAPVINPSPLLCKLLVELDADLQLIRLDLSKVVLKDFEKSFFSQIDHVLFEEVKRHGRVWDYEDAILWSEDMKHIWQSRNQNPASSQFVKCKEMIIVLTLPTDSPQQQQQQQQQVLSIDSSSIATNTKKAVIGSSVSAELVNRTLTSRREDIAFCQKYLSETLGIYQLTPDLVLDILGKRRDWQRQPKNF